MNCMPILERTPARIDMPNALQTRRLRLRSSRQHQNNLGNRFNSSASHIMQIHLD
jgi:hypothetical protein